MKLPEIDLEELEKLKEQNFRERLDIMGQRPWSASDA